MTTLKGRPELTWGEKDLGKSIKNCIHNDMVAEYMISFCPSHKPKKNDIYQKKPKKTKNKTMTLTTKSTNP